jgi:hypothetical protein
MVKRNKKTKAGLNVLKKTPWVNPYNPCLVGSVDYQFPDNREMPKAITPQKLASSLSSKAGLNKVYKSKIKPTPFPKKMSFFSSYGIKS